MRGSVLIMAKAPQPGRVKTRLAPLLGASGCARLQAELIRHTAAWARDAAPRVWLAYAPRDARGRIGRLAGPGVGLLPQAGPDLGARLAAATAQVLARGEAPVFAIGTDAPLLGPADVAAARDALAAGHEVALVPALDGGYAMIALTRALPEAFAIPVPAWGGPEVLELTLAALRGRGLRIALLDPVGDLDTPDDALALRAHPGCPPRIRAALRPEARSRAARPGVGSEARTRPDGAVPRHGVS